MTNQIIEAPAQTVQIIDVSTVESWTAQGESLYTQHRETLWAIAGWMEAGVQEFGNEAQQIALAVFGKSNAELRRIMDTAKRFPPEARRAELTFNHHALTLPLTAEQADEVLNSAAETKASLSHVRKAVNVIRESQGGDIFQQMAAIGLDELVDDWTGKMIRLSNRAPTQEARNYFREMLDEADNGLIMGVN